jgi:hypothetical protein
MSLSSDFNDVIEIDLADGTESKEFFEIGVRGDIRGRISLGPLPPTPKRNIGLSQDKLVGTDFNKMIIVGDSIVQRDRLSSKREISSIEAISKLSNFPCEFMANAVEIAGSKFCVSSEDGQKLYQAIRSALLDEKKVLISFEGNANISSAFLEEAISNLYNGEFKDEDLDQRIEYRGLSEDDLHLLENIIEWTKQDLNQSVSIAEAYYD